MLPTILLSFSMCVVAPQAQGEERFVSVLPKSDQDSLRGKVRDWFEAQYKLRDADGRQREMLSKRESQARDKFLKDWETKSKKRDLLACVGDLRAIFTGCFEFERQTGSTDVRAFKPRGAMEFDAVVPKRYRPEVPVPTVLLLRGHTDNGWALASKWWEATWKPAAEAADFMAILPQLDSGMDLDPPLDQSKDEGRSQDGARYNVVLGSIGSAYQILHLDRERIYLDCARGSCLFGLRLAATFPQMFAGVILREPVDPGDLRLESLTGMPVLLLRTDATKEVCEKIATALNKLEEGACTLLDAKGEYPHSDSAGEVIAWTKTRHRDIARKRVVIANNYDTFRRAHWVVMGKAASLLEVAGDARPYLEVVADRAANRINVTARSVSDFGLYLNDALLDLDKEFTVVVNGKALPPMKAERSLKAMCDMIFRSRDPGHLFPAERTIVVPEEKSETAEKAGADSPAK